MNENIFNAILNVSSEMCPANAVQQRKKVPYKTPRCKRHEVYMDDEMQSEHADRNDGSSHGHVIQFHRLDN